MSKSPTLLLGVEAVELVAPDRQSAVALLQRTRSAFPALVDDSGWIVRYQRPAATEADWVADLLALVERSLQAGALPAA